MQANMARAEAFIATSLDGFIVREDGDIGWLTGHQVPDGEDYGYAGFMAGVGAIVMGRATYDTVRGFADWPYQVPVSSLAMRRTRWCCQTPCAAGCASQQTARRRCWWGWPRKG